MRARLLPRLVPRLVPRLALRLFDVMLATMVFVTLT